MGSSNNSSVTVEDGDICRRFQRLAHFVVDCSHGLRRGLQTYRHPRRLSLPRTARPCRLRRWQWGRIPDGTRRRREDRFPFGIYLETYIPEDKGLIRARRSAIGASSLIVRQGCRLLPITAWLGLRIGIRQVFADYVLCSGRHAQTPITRCVCRTGRYGNPVTCNNDNHDLHTLNCNFAFVK